jgi:hypothetical protein
MDGLLLRNETNMSVLEPRKDGNKEEADRIETTITENDDGDNSDHTIVIGHNSSSIRMHYRT